MAGQQPSLLPSGTIIGRFQLTGQIAVGGMAEVYRARCSGIGGFEREVVLKRLLPELARHDGFVRMFLDEARLGARLQHPNVAQVLDVGLEGSIPYLAMEYVDGRSLLDIVAAAGAEPMPL